jgi:hypothetical protein
MVETASDEILAGAAEQDVAFLVVGDPLGCAAFAIDRAIPDTRTVPRRTRTCSSAPVHLGSRRA